MSAGRHSRRPTRRRLIAAILVANMLVLTANAITLFARDDDSPAKPVSRTTSDARTQAVLDLLSIRSAAVSSRDRDQFLSTVDPTQKSFYAAQGRLFDNLGSVPLGTWSYTVDLRDLGVATPVLKRYGVPVYTPAVSLSYTLKGYDAKPALLQQRFTFVKRASGWLIASDSDFAQGAAVAGRGIWDYGQVIKAVGKASLVLGHPRNKAQLASIAALADDAVTHVTAVWGTGWSRKVVVLVPDTQEELASIISEGSDLSEIAAVAVAQNAGGLNPSQEFGDRVILNPTNFSQLSPVGSRVILRHEVTHVATRSVTGSIAPQWLVEGIADYIGYRDAGIAVSVVAHELAEDVHKGYTPSVLPDDSGFQSDTPKLAQNYELAWMACRLIVSKKGEAGLVKLYREVGLSKKHTELAALEDAFQDVLGLSYEDFVAQWRTDVVRELS